MQANKDYVNQVLRSKQIKGPEYDCEHYPCHFNAQDCTWCFGPFYSCGDSLTGGKLIESGRTRKLVWSCEDCNWIHQQEPAKLILNGLLHLASRIEDISKEKLLQIRLKALMRNMNKAS